jgi:probable F420-dependent oxidoreductase
MHFGFQWFATDEGPRPDDVARLLEQRGFESLFVAEHTHIPTSRISPAPEGGELPRMYTRTLDPFVALTAAACATTRLRLGTGICLAAQHHPITLAKTVASLVHLAGDRVLFGVGAGWNLEELADHGIEGPDRFGVLREHVEAMRALWTTDPAQYQGRHVRFGPSWSWPKPARAPSVLLGAVGERAVDRVIAFADEWAPPDFGPDTMIPRLRELRQGAARAGRDPVPVTLFGGPTAAELLDRYAEEGVHRVVYALPPVPDLDGIDRELDRVASALAAPGDLPVTHPATTRSSA